MDESLRIFLKRVTTGAFGRKMHTWAIQQGGKAQPLKTDATKTRRPFIMVVQPSCNRRVAVVFTAVA